MDPNRANSLKIISADMSDNKNLTFQARQLWQNSSCKVQDRVKPHAHHVPSKGRQSNKIHTANYYDHVPSVVGQIPDFVKLQDKHL